MRSLEILKLLNSSREGLTGKKLFNMLSDENYEAFRAYLSYMLKRGFVRIDGKRECKECGSEYICHRITEKGRLHLSN